MTELLLKEVSLFWTILTGVIGGIFGLIFGFLPYCFMNKKDRKELSIKLQNEADEIVEKIDVKSQEFKDELCNFSKLNNVSIDDFNKITKFANAYFSQLKICCDNILSNTISLISMENTLLPHIKETVEKDIIKKYYQILRKSARKSNIPYKGQYKKEYYKSIFIVYGKFIKNNIKNKIIVFLLEHIK